MKQLLLLFVVAGCVAADQPTTPMPQPARQEYVVLFTQQPTDVNARAVSGVQRSGARVRYVYRHALPGFAAELSAAEAEALRGQGAKVTPVRHGSFRRQGGQQSDPDLTLNWMLDRADQSALPL